MTALEIVNSIPKRFKTEKWNGKPTTVALIFAEPQSLTKWILVNEKGAELFEGEKPDADCTVRCKGEVYAQMELGQLNPQWALVSGKVKVSNIPLMMEFAKWFRRVKPEIKDNEANQSTKRPKLSGPLEGIRVLDFSRLLPGPMASLLMAEMGAEVIKIEDTDSPDPIRQFMPIVEGISAFYGELNRNKKSFAKSLSSEEGKNVIFDLVKTADVVVEGFRPGIMKKMGFDYATFQALNPKIVYISITGYGQTGPLAHLAGHDLNYMALSGMLALVPDGKQPAFQAADIAGGAYAALSAVLAALLQQKTTGIGTFIDLSMTEAVMPMGVLARVNNEFNPHQGFELSGEMPNYRTYQTLDMQFVALGALEPKFWERFCRKANKNHLLNIYTASAAEKMQAHQELELFFAQKTKMEWQTWSEGEDFCLSPVLNFEDIREHPHFKHRNIFGAEGHLSSPLRFVNANPNQGWKAPLLGEDNAGLDL
jgi:crotonobetainyl-CoA:carnitine CoA-transferase CaiB-like acyl-CoA transferase/putative sterol carrier protein